MRYPQQFLPWPSTSNPTYFNTYFEYGLLHPSWSNTGILYDNNPVRRRSWSTCQSNMLGCWPFLLASILTCFEMVNLSRKKGWKIYSKILAAKFDQFKNTTKFWNLKKISNKKFKGGWGRDMVGEGRVWMAIVTVVTRYEIGETKLTKAKAISTTSRIGDGLNGHWAPVGIHRRF